jgi:glycosyltransferase involved in cell wall biosynthesis
MRARITIDATSLLLRSAGVKNYTYHWLRHLRQAAGHSEKIAAFPFLADVSRLDHEASALSFWQTAPRLAALYAVNALGPVALDAAIGQSGIFHASNQVHHAPRRARLTATLHDLTAFLMPELHTAGNVRADGIFAERILKRADRLIAVSENTRQDAIRVLKIAPERITTIYSGVPDEYFDAGPAGATRRQAKPYVLFVGAIEPRKNLETLLDAWGGLSRELREAFDLAVAGPMGWAPEATQARIRSEAVYLGYVPEAELPGLMAGAAAFVYPSLYEGFGFPVAQAMAARVAVVTSNVSCLPEVAGGGALLVDPRSRAEIAGALTRLLESETLRAELAARGREQANQYRWEKCAAESLEFFRRVMA